MRFGQKLLDAGRLRREERGNIDIKGLVLMGIGMIFLAVGFVIYPIVMDATDTILAWTCTANASISDATFTGLTEVTGIVPLLVLVAFVTAGAITGFLGYKVASGQAEASTSNPASLILLGIGLIFIAVGLIIFPVVLESVCVVLTGGGAGISSSYTGLEAILLVTPLIVLIAFVTAGVVAGYFGIKTMT